MTFDDLQKLLREKLQIERLSDVARELSVTPQVVSNWKARNQVPYKYVKLLRNKLEKLSNDNKSEFKDRTIIMGYPESKDNSIDEISITETMISIYVQLKKNINVIIFGVIFFLLIGIYYSFIYSQPVYTSNAKIIPISDQESSGSMGGLAANFGINIPSSGSGSGLLSPIIYPDIINSRRLIESALNRNFSTSKYDTSLPLINILRGEPSINYVWSEIEILQSVETLRDMISINVSRKNPIITIYTRAFEPSLSSRLLSVIIEELNKLLKLYSEDRIKEKLKFIEIRINQVGVDLKKYELSLEKFREQNRSINSSPALLIEQGRIVRDLDVQTEIFTTLKTELELAKIEQVEDNSMVLVIDGPELPIYKTSPKNLKNLILSILLGIFCSILFIYGKDWYKQNFKNFY